jgi:response regulator RpfG family c-di-GMP phosphodiesterase
MSMHAKIPVLYVDDEVNNIVSFRATFRNTFKIFTATSAKEGLEILEREKVHIVITDQRMPEVTGVEFLKMVLLRFPATIRILLTGYSDMQAVIDAVNEGRIFYYHTKPWDEQQLRTTLFNASELYQLREENERLLVELARVNEQLEFLLRQKLLS